jgi:hypothetical protein
MVGLNRSEPAPRGPHKDDTVTMRDAQSGAWLLEPEQRPMYYRLVSGDVPHHEAMRGARDLAYAAELLRRRQPSAEMSRSTEDAMAVANQKAAAEHEYWATVAIPGEDEPSPPQSGQGGRIRERVASLSNVAIRAATGGKAAPSQQPEGRRARYIRLRAKQLGISETEAEAMIPRRQAS